MPTIKDEVVSVLLKAYAAAVRHEQILYYDDNDPGEGPYFLRPDNIRPHDKSFVFEKTSREDGHGTGRCTIAFDSDMTVDELDHFRGCFFQLNRLEL